MKGERSCREAAKVKTARVHSGPSGIEEAHTLA